IPVVAGIVNSVNKNSSTRKLIENTLGVDARAKLPEYHSSTLRKRLSKNDSAQGEEAGPTKGKVALFATCYGNYNAPSSGEDLKAVFEHNEIPVTLLEKEQCCGMPKLELGDLEAVAAAKEVNIPAMVKMVDAGWDLVAPVPSCVLMFKQELPLMFPDDADVAKVAEAMFDPFEYLMLRHKHGKLKTDFKQPLGKVAWHVACHQRVQRIGPKTRELLELIPDTSVDTIERCSGHDGTYAVKKEFHDVSMKIARPVAKKVTQSEADHYTSDCVMAAQHISNTLADDGDPEHPISLIRKAYGI
ncbi:heterodisulfide reductase-related iron-sulfur binding cluster, partial [Solemya velum gill symbiont]